MRTETDTQSQWGERGRAFRSFIDYPARPREDIRAMKEWIVCEDNCLKCSYGATLDCDGDCPRCPRNTYCPCVTFVSFAAGKLAPVVQPVTTTFERPRKR
jgi:hypothetical protein